MEQLDVKTPETFEAGNMVRWKRQDLNKAQVSIMFQCISMLGYAEYYMLIKVNGSTEERISNRDESLLTVKNISDNQIMTLPSFWMEKIG